MPGSAHAGLRGSGAHLLGRGACGSGLAEALTELEASGWLVLHDLQRPGRRFGTIDHIAIGPGGIVVIDAKDWAGEVDVVSGVLTQNGQPRTRETDLAAAAGAAVTAWLEPAHRTAVMPLICLVSQPTPTRQPAAVAVYSVDDLALSLRALPVRLRTGEVWAIADMLRRTLADGSIPVQLTTASLAAALAGEQVDAGSGSRRATRWSGLRARLSRLLPSR